MSKIICLIIWGSAAIAGMSGKEIMTKHEDVRKVSDVISSAKITTGGGGKRETVKEFTWWRKLQNDGVRYNTLTRFWVPAEVKNQGILFLERENDKTEVQMYLPAYKKVRRVESQQQSGSFMGSEFSFADIASPHVDDYTYKTKADETCPTDKAVKCFVLESFPANEDVKNRTGSNSATLWVRQDNFMLEKAIYNDLENQPWKQLEASEFKIVEPKEKKWMALRVKMQGLKSGKFTLMEFKDVKVNTNLGENIFTVQNLSREN